MKGERSENVRILQTTSEKDGLGKCGLENFPSERDKRVGERKEMMIVDETVELMYR